MKDGDDCVNCGSELRLVREFEDGRKRFKCWDCGWGWTDWTDKEYEGVSVT